MKKYTQTFLKSLGTILFFIVCTGALVAVAAWQEPNVQGPNNWPAGNTVSDYQPEHILSAHQTKNDTIRPDYTIAVGAQPPFAGGAMVQAFSPFFALVVGNFSSNNTLFPEATYVEGMTKEIGNIVAESRDDFLGINPVVVPGKVSANIQSYVGDVADSRDVLYLDGANDTALPANAPENNMVNILLKDDVNNPNLNPTNRFGIEQNSGNGKFASLRMGEVSVDRAFVGGLVSSLDTAISGTDNYIGNFNFLPHIDNINNPRVLQGTLSSGPAAATATTTKFSNIGYGDYCYLQNPRVGAICPDGFFLSKYDGNNEAICRSFNPSVSPSAIDVPSDFRKNIDNYNDVGYYFENLPLDCKSLPPKYVCNDGADNDGDNLSDANDPGCINDGVYEPTDMSEKNVPPPPPPAAIPWVTAQLKGPYLGKGCNYNAPLGGFAIDEDKSDWITFVDNAPTNVTPGTYPPPNGWVAPDLYQDVAYIEYTNSMPKVPAVGDVVITSGHYGYVDALGASGYVKKGPVVPGWYFIQKGPGGTLYKIKLNWANNIVDVKSC